MATRIGISAFSVSASHSLSLSLSISLLPLLFLCTALSVSLTSFKKIERIYFNNITYAQIIQCGNINGFPAAHVICATAKLIFPAFLPHDTKLIALRTKIVHYAEIISVITGQS